MNATSQSTSYLGTAFPKLFPNATWPGFERALFGANETWRFPAGEFLYTRDFIDSTRLSCDKLAGYWSCSLGMWKFAICGSPFHSKKVYERSWTRGLRGIKKFYKVKLNYHFYCLNVGSDRKNPRLEFEVKAIYCNIMIERRRCWWFQINTFATREWRFHILGRKLWIDIPVSLGLFQVLNV
jgi:hypothetical protein